MDGQALDLIHLLMLCLAWNSRSLHSFLDENTSPALLQNPQFRRPKSTTTMTTTKMCHHLLKGEAQRKCTLHKWYVDSLDKWEPLKSNKLEGNPSRF